MASGADTLANTLLPSLVGDKDFTFPTVDLEDPLFDQPAASGPVYGTITALAVTDLTVGTVGGTGVFDKLMMSLKAHLKEEYTAGRISGAEYTKAYTSLVSAALQTATQFLLGRDQAYWSALLVQQQAQLATIEKTKARVELETARFQLVRAQYESVTAEANYALTKIKLSTEDATFGNLTKQGEGLDYTNANILPTQKKLLEEQVEVQRAQTLDTRSDTATIMGMVGKQKELYSQQITSYKRDAETKVAKIFVDSWITQKTIDEGTLAPDNFTNANINTLLSNLRTNLSI